jgi:hypothetical protein
MDNTVNRLVRITMVVAGLICAPELALAQNATPEPTQKAVGSAETQIVPSLIVLNAHSASLQGQTLTLNGVAPSSIIFADRPVRAAGHALTSHLLAEWATGDNSFAKNPPNATVSVFNEDGSTVSDAVVVLKAPKLEGERLTFNVQVLEGDLAGANGPASLFIDSSNFEVSALQSMFPLHKLATQHATLTANSDRPLSAGNVRFGSLADITAATDFVRFVPLADV